LVRTDFELLPRFFVHVRGPQHAVLVLHRGQRNRPCEACAGPLCGFDDLRRGLIQNAVIVCLQPDPNFFVSYHVSLSNPSRLPGKKELAASCTPRLSCGAGALARGFDYCTISLMVPAPTVWPPSRIANRKPFSIATGVINSITSCTLSPGITISVPEGSSATPVTSVVRK